MYTELAKRIKKLEEKVKCIACSITTPTPQDGMIDPYFYVLNNDFIAQNAVSNGGVYELTTLSAAIPDDAIEFELHAFVTGNSASFNTPTVKAEFSSDSPAYLTYEILCSQGVAESGITRDSSNYTTNAVFTPTTAIGNLHTVRITGTLASTTGNITFGYGGFTGLGNYILLAGSYIKFTKYVPTIQP